MSLVLIITISLISFATGALFFFLLDRHKKSDSEVIVASSKEIIENEDISSPHDQTRKVKLVDIQELLNIDHEVLEAEPANESQYEELEKAEQTIEILNKKIQELEIINKVNEVNVKEFQRKIELPPASSPNNDHIMFN